ncbi:2007_t:CDS:2 [Acaulospora morrowiae]|uniref:2007_t:CDS:1 n=1 Tax=Acaulospora morrowiae TaxID=94023 RepID=A0A9N8WK41_9GLOM|nr:2007_t:CDS:2 [Acaulospora morrowiae]
MDGKALYQTLNKILDTQQMWELFFFFAHSTLTENPYSILVDIAFREEIGLLPYQSTETNSEIYPFLLIGTNLGIPLETVREIFKFAYGIFMKIRQNHVQNSSEITSSIEETIRLLKQSTRCLMLLNPDFHSAANTRKKLIADNFLDPIEELKLLDLILTFPKHTKNSTVWYHRKWVISKVISLDHSGHLTRWKNEILIARRVAELYPKNYYAWTYRHWIITQLSIGAKQFLDEELEDMKTWIETNVSDHSGFHHRQRCLVKMSQLYNENVIDFCGISRRDLLGMIVEKRMETARIDESLAFLWFEEIQLTKGLILRYPGHETLWYHLRFLSFTWKWLNAAGYIYHLKDSDIEVIRSDEEELSGLLKAWPDDQSEIEFARHCMQKIDVLQLDDSCEVHDNLVKQKRYALSYELWISELYCISNDDVKTLISKLADIIPESNYYGSRKL